MYKLKLVFVLITSIFLWGCASDEYYRDEAAESAREFLLNDLKHISPENKAYINYTYPDILQAPILPGADSSQLCFAWSLPSPKITLLVYGTSKNDFKAWFPVRVIFKNYTEEEAKQMTKIELEEAIKMGEISEEVSARESGFTF